MQWQNDDLGQLVRGIRPVDSAEGITPALVDDRPGGSGASGSGFSVPVQHFWTIRHAIAHFYQRRDRKSTRLNSSHSQISYAVFCLKKKKKHADSRVVVS